MEKKKHKNRKDLTKFLFMILVSVCVVGAVLIPLPYYIEVPGSAENVRDFVSVDGKRDKNTGSFMLTTVGIRPSNLISLISAKLIPFQDVISKQDLMGDSSNEDYARLTKFQMTSSENMAKKVALDLVKEPYDFSYKGVYVMGVSADSDFKQALKAGDIVHQVDQTTFKNAEEFMTYVQSKKVGDELTISYTRNQEELTTKGKLIELAELKKAGIGITLVDHSELETKKEIKIQAEDIGGPSAGLMFTLELYELLSGKDLRKGREIAGTGTINSEGVVGSIGGIDKKVVAADKMAATVFFAPDEAIDKKLLKKYPELQTNYQEAQAAAKKIGSKMEIVPVSNIQDALDYLEK